MPELEIPQGFSIAEEPKLEIPQGFSLSKEPELQVPGGFSIAEEPELQIPEGFSLGEPESGMPDAARRAIGTLAPVKQAKYLGGVLQNPIVQRILESTRESTVGLGGIARGIRTGISSGEAGSALEAASESIKQRRGLGKEIVDPLMEPGIKKGIAGFAAEVATDPINFITLGGITRLVSKAARVARPIVKVGVARKAAQQVGEFSGIRVSGDDLITELERVVELSNKAKEASIAPQAIMTTAERDLLKQYAPQIKSAQDFKVPMRALVSETEKRAFVKSMAGQPMEAVERQVVQPLKELPPIETPPISRIGGETLSVKAGNFSQRFEKRMANIEELNTRAKLAVENVESIGQTGTLPKDIRPGFRKTQPFGTTESEIRAFRVSQNSVKQSAKELINAVTEFQTLERELIVKGDALSSNTARAIGDQLRGMKKKINAYAEGYSMQRFATNRALKGFDGPVPRGIIDTLKQQGVIIKGLTQAKERLPITTNILKGLKNFNKMTPVERHRFWGDVVDQFRLNLFAAHSFTLDVIGNAGELTAQVASGVGHDLVYMAKGKPTFPMTSGFLRAIRDRGKTFGHPIIKPIEEGFGMTASGEFFGGLGGNSGAFTMRSTLGSKIFDYLVGGPLYLKGFADSEAKRFAATASLWKTATKTADKMKLAGTERTIFYEKFMREIPDSAIDDAIVAGNKAGFNRELTATEEKIASSIGARLFVDAFARWPFQFARWGMEMVGYNKAIWKKIKAGTVGAEEVGEYVTKTATGWGGIYMLDRTLYDRVDFSTLEYVHPTGNRTRLSNREPLATGLILLAIMKGDADKAAAGMKFASLPGARLLTGEGGLLTSIVAQFNNFAESRKVSPRRMYDEVSSVVNRMIPGQALLGTIKTIFDPVIREGIGANIPGVSLLKPSVPKPTTGEPLRPRQKLPFIGTEVPSVVGGVIPGAERIMDPIEILLRDYGFTPYKGMRSPIAGVPPNEIPPHLKREWTIELGKARQQYFGPLVNNPTMLTRLKESDYDISREIIQGFDSDSAALATTKIEKKYGLDPLGDRQLTGRERSLPEFIKKKIQRDRDKKFNMRMGKSFENLSVEEKQRYVMEQFLQQGNNTKQKPRFGSRIGEAIKKNYLYNQTKPGTPRIGPVETTIGPRRSEIRPASPAEKLIGSFRRFTGTDSPSGEQSPLGYLAKVREVIGTPLENLGGPVKGFGALDDIARVLGRGDNLVQMAAPAFHGTGVSKLAGNKFSLKYIGSGEGAQAYGWGIYLAENPRVAGQYAAKLGPGRGVTPRDIGARVMEAVGQDKQKAIKEIYRRISTAKSDKFAAKMGAVIDAIRSGDTKGALLKVDIPDGDIAKMLDWDVPLSKQAESVKDALGPDVVKRQGHMTGGAWYEGISKTPLAPYGGRQEYASRFIASKGIPGIKYKDAFSRTDLNLDAVALKKAIAEQKNNITKARQSPLMDRDDIVEHLESQLSGLQDELKRASKPATRNMVIFDEGLLKKLDPKPTR